jgi:hypothetical protein
MTAVKHAFRVLRKSPGFTAVAICSMALGIGATSEMFSFADAILLRPLPVADSSRVVAIDNVKSAPFGVNPMVSYPDYADLRDLKLPSDLRASSALGVLALSANAQYLYVALQDHRKVDVAQPH